MKQTKKLLLAVLCVALVLASTLLVVAACGSKSYTITLEQYDPNQGFVVYSDPLDGDSYKDGENVTLTVTPAAGYEVGSVKINGTEVQLESDGTYTFVISQNTNIAVTFRQLLNVTVRINIAEGITNSSSCLSAPANGTQYAAGETVTLTLVPHADYEVESVKIGEQTLTAADGKYTFQATVDPTVVEVTVKKVKFDVTVTCTPQEGGTALPSQAAAGEGQKYSLGENVIVTVAAAQNYVVKSVTVNGQPLEPLEDEKDKYTFSVTQDTTVVVEFEQTYTVRAYLDPEEAGSVTFQPQQDRYRRGDVVTMTIAINEGYFLGDVTINLRLASPQEDGSYKFTVEGNTTIDVEFITPGDVLAQSLNGSVKFDGTTSLAGSEVAIQAIFDESVGNQQLYIEQRDQLGRVVYALAGVNNNGHLDIIRHQPAENGAPYVYNPDDTLDYRTYNNPFITLDGRSLTNDGEGIWTLDNEVAAEAILRLTRDNVTVTSAKLHEQNGKFVKFEVVATYTYNTQSYEYSATFDISEHGTATVPAVYLGTAPTDSNLRAALQAAAAADSYKLAVDLGGITWDVYYADNAICFDDDSDQYGFYERPDGSVWYFEMDEEGNFVKGEQLSSSGGIVSYSAIFDLGITGYNYFCLFYDTGDGRYEMYPNDQLVETSNTRVAAALGYIFFDVEQAGYDEYVMGAWDIAITLGDNGEFTVIFNVSVTTSDGVPSVIELKLAFTQFGSAELPIEIPQTAIDGVIDPSFTGEYIDEGMQYRLYATMDEFILNSVHVGKDNITENEDGSLTLNVDGKNYTLRLGEEENTLILNDGKTDVTLVTSRWFNWVGFYEGYNTGYILKIGPTQITVTIEDEEYVARSIEFDDSYGIAQFEFVLTNGDIIYLEQYTEDNYEIFQADMDGDLYVDVIFTHAMEGINLSLSPAYGEYESLRGTGNSLKIDANGIVLTTGGQSYTGSMIGLYTDTYVSVAISFTANGTDYMLMQYAENGFGMWYLLDDEFNILDLFIISANVADPEDYLEFAGTFIGGDDQNEYKVVISSDGIHFYIDDVEKQITKSYFDLFDYTQQGDVETDERYQLYFYADGVWYYMQQYPGRDDIFFFSAGDEVILYLDKYSEQDDWSRFSGEFEGDGYSVTITADSITITPDDGEAGSAESIVFYSDYDYDGDYGYYAFEFTYDGKECGILIHDNGDSIELIIQDGESAVSYLLINKTYKPRYDLSEMVGYWEGEAISAPYTEYALKITKDAILLSVDGSDLEQVTILYYSETIGYICELNGTRYQLIYIDETDDAAGTFAQNIVLYANDNVALMSRAVEPSDWAAYEGTWEGVDTHHKEVTYTVVIDSTSIHVTSSDNQWDFTVDKNTYAFQWLATAGMWRWSYDSKDWYLTVANEQLDLYYNNGNDLDAYLDKKDGPAPKPELDINGLWYTSYGEYYLLILQNYIIFDNSEASDVVTTETGYTFTWGTYSCVLTYDEERDEITLAIGNVTTLKLRQCAYGDFLGMWDSGSSYGYADGEYTLDISTEGIILVMPDGTKKTAVFVEVGQSERGAALLNITIDGTLYQIQQANHIGDEYAEFTAVGLISQQNVFVSYFWRRYITLTDVTEWWESFPATYEGEFQGVNYKVEIAQDGTVTVTIDGEATVAEEVLFLEDLDHFTGQIYGLMNFTLDGKTAGLYISANADYVVLVQEGVEEQVLLYRDGEMPSWADLIGVYEGTDAKSGTSYKLTIEADRVLVQIGDGEAVEATIESYDSYEGFELTVNGETYFVMAEETDTGLVIYFSDADTFSIQLAESAVASPDAAAIGLEVYYSKTRNAVVSAN